MYMHLLMGCMQTVADEHVDSLGIGWRELNAQNYFWVLYRFGIQIIRMPIKYDHLTITTWANTPTSVIQPRNFEVTDAQGNIIVKAHTLWTILDGEKFATHNIHDILKDEIKPYYVDDKVIPMNLKISKISLPDDFVPQPKDVLYTDIDYNQHVNNTVYSRWLFDSYPIEFLDTHDLAGITLNYTQQSRLGEKYAIYTMHKSELEHYSLIYNAETGTEICKIKTIWAEKH